MDLFFNPYANPTNLPISFEDHRAGSVFLLVSICKQDVCIDKKLLLYRLSGDVKKIALMTPTDKVVVGASLPLQVRALDAYGNRVDTSRDIYQVALSTGYFEETHSALGSPIVRFQDAFYTINTDKLSPESSFDIILLLKDEDKQIDIPLMSKTIHVVSGNIVVQDLS